MRDYPVSIKAVIPRSGKVALLRNERSEWELPGGRLEPGETPEDCLRREVREELGLDVRVGEILHAWLYEAYPGREVFVVAYGCVDLGGEISHSDEHDAARWFEVWSGLDELLLPAGYRTAINRLLTGDDHARKTRNLGSSG